MMRASDGISVSTLACGLAEAQVRKCIASTGAAMCSCSPGIMPPRALDISPFSRKRCAGTRLAPRQPGAHAPAAAPQVVKLDHDFGTKFSGVLTDAGGRLRALWGSYSEQVCRAPARLRPTAPGGAALHRPAVPEAACLRACPAEVQTGGHGAPGERSEGNAARPVSVSELRSGTSCLGAGRGRSPALNKLAPRAPARPARRPHSGRAKTRAQAASGSQDREWTAGMPAAVFAPWVAAVLGGLGAARPPGAAAPAPLRVAVLGAELEPLLLSRAAQVGLPAAWVAALARLDPLRRQARRGPPARRRLLRLRARERGPWRPRRVCCGGVSGMHESDLRVLVEPGLVTALTETR